MCSFPMYIFFTIIDKACKGPLVGVIGLVNASPAFVKIDIAWPVVFSRFSTLVTTNPVAFSLNYCLESLSMPKRPGSGLCACSGWATQSESPCATARRMGFEKEGVMRWNWVLLDGMEENGRLTWDGDLESPRAEWNSVVLSAGRRSVCV